MTSASRPLPDAAPQPPRPRRICLLGASGAIGRATARAFVARGHHVVCFMRPRGRQRNTRGEGERRAPLKALVSGLSI